MAPGVGWEMLKMPKMRKILKMPKMLKMLKINAPLPRGRIKGPKRSRGFEPHGGLEVVVHVVAVARLVRRPTRRGSQYQSVSVYRAHKWCLEW